MNAFARSWEITKMSFGVINQDKEMLVFPMLAGIFSILYAAALLFPTIIVEFIKEGSDRTFAVTNTATGTLEYFLLGLTYLGISFIATFFNTCVVYTAKVRFEGGDATFMDSIKFAFSKIGLVFSWSMVAATVGLLLSAIDNAAERMGGPGKVIVSILHTILGLAWSIVTIFVVPAMVYDNLGPIEAIKKSAQTVKNTWGESLIRHYGLGFISAIFIFLGFGLAVLLFMGAAGLGPTGMVAAASITGIYFLAVILVFQCANMVFNVALYAFANQKIIPSSIDEDILRDVFQSRV
jgi:hypothetical protein